MLVLGHDAKLWAAIAMPNAVLQYIPAAVGVSVPVGLREAGKRAVTDQAGDILGPGPAVVSHHIWLCRPVWRGLRCASEDDHGRIKTT